MFCSRQARKSRGRFDLVNQVVPDFYTVDQLAIAKTRLCDDIEKLQLDIIMAETVSTP